MNGLHREVEVVTELARKSIQEEAHAAITEDDGLDRNSVYLERHRKAVMRLAELENLKREKQSKRSALESFVRNIENQNDSLDTFDDRLWAATIDNVAVMQNGKLVFRFRDGTEIGTPE